MGFFFPLAGPRLAVGGGVFIRSWRGGRSVGGNGLAAGGGEVAEEGVEGGGIWGVGGLELAADLGGGGNFAGAAGESDTYTPK